MAYPMFSSSSLPNEWKSGGMTRRTGFTQLQNPSNSASQTIGGNTYYNENPTSNYYQARPTQQTASSRGYASSSFLNPYGGGNLFNQDWDPMAPGAAGSIGGKTNTKGGYNGMTVGGVGNVMGVGGGAPGVSNNYNEWAGGYGGSMGGYGGSGKGAASIPSYVNNIIRQQQGLQDQANSKIEQNQADIEAMYGGALKGLENDPLAKQLQESIMKQLTDGGGISPKIQADLEQRARAMAAADTAAGARDVLARGGSAGLRGGLIENLLNANQSRGGALGARNVLDIAHQAELSRQQALQQNTAAGGSLLNNLYGIRSSLMNPLAQFKSAYNPQVAQLNLDQLMQYAMMNQQMQNQGRQQQQPMTFDQNPYGEQTGIPSYVQQALKNYNPIIGKLPDMSGVRLPEMPVWMNGSEEDVPRFTMPGF